MAGETHTLKADPTTGKVEFNSIRGFAVQKLQSVVELVPQDVRATAAAALAKATEAAAKVTDPSLKPGGKAVDRPAAVKKLGDSLKELSIAIRVFGDSGKITDADPAVVQKVRVEEEARLRRMAQGQKPGDPSPGVPIAAANSPVAAPAPGSAAEGAKANPAAAAAAAPSEGGFQKNDQKAAPDSKGRSAAQTAAVATADPKFGGKVDEQGRPTETVAQAALRVDKNRDSNFNPKVKVEFEKALAAAILANPALYAASVYEISGKILAYIDTKAKAGISSANTELAKLASSPTWFGSVAVEANATKDQIADAMRKALGGGGTIPNHLAAHQQFLGEILIKDWPTEICQAFVGEAAVDPTFVRRQTKIKNGELSPDGTTVFDKKNPQGEAERGRVARPGKSTPIGAAAGPVPKSDDGSDPAPLIPDDKTVDNQSAGTKQQMDRGTDIFTMDEAKPFVQRARLKINKPLIAGISGSTAELINCAMTLGLSGEALHKYALAVLGYIGGGGNHSFVEMVTVLKAAGLPVNPDTYEGFYPAVFAQKFAELKRQYPEAFKDEPPATSQSPRS
jgi:hypothetical protein